MAVRGPRGGTMSGHRFKKVLIISKMTELEFDENKYGAAVDEYHKLQNTNVKKLERNHEYHYRSLETIVHTFQENGITPGIIKKQNLGRSDFKEAWDMIVPTGGDGTFMDAARYVRDETLFFGIKSTPKSVGGHYDTNFGNAVEHIHHVLRGDFSVERRTRIEGVVRSDITITDLALNDLYVGDRYIVGYSRLEIHLNGGVVKANGNGVVFSTFHGRTGWYDNIPVFEKDPGINRRVREALQSRGLSGDVSFHAGQCDFSPEEHGIIKYKILMRDRKGNPASPDYGTIHPGETCTVISKVPSNGCVSFDGNKTSRPRHRMYDLFNGKSVTVRVADAPLLVVRPGGG